MIACRIKKINGDETVFRKPLVLTLVRSVAKITQKLNFIQLLSWKGVQNANETGSECFKISDG